MCVGRCSEGGPPARDEGSSTWETVSEEAGKKNKNHIKLCISLGS